MRLNPVGLERAAAAEQCAAEGAELAYIADRATQEAIATLLRRKVEEEGLEIFDNVYWLGAAWDEGQGGWHWENHEEEDFKDYNNWLHGEDSEKSNMIICRNCRDIDFRNNHRHRLSQRHL